MIKMVCALCGVVTARPRWYRPTAVPHRDGQVKAEHQVAATSLTVPGDTDATRGDRDGADDADVSVA